VGTTIVVPAVVESKSGEIAYGLSVDSFSIKDNGIEQRVHMESDPGAQPWRARSFVPVDELV